MASPLQVALHLLLQSYGAQLTHSGAVSLNGNSALFIGKGGSGKSTLTLACVESGLEFIGEDYTVLSNRANLTVSSIYQSGKVTQHTADLFPNIEKNIENEPSFPEEKGLFYYDRLFPSKVQNSAMVRSIIVPCIASCKTPYLEEVSWRTNLPSLLFSTMKQLPLNQKRTIQTLQEIARRRSHYKTPC